MAGASDNDPTTVATLAVVGAATTYGLAWLVLLVIPMLVTIQSIAARVGEVSGRGLQASIRLEYGRPVALAALACVLASNLVTLAADLEGGGAALQLLFGVDYRWFVVPIAAVTAIAMTVASANRTATVLKYVTLVFFAYVVTAVLARPNWGDVAAGSLVPHVTLSTVFVTNALALLGTTLTSYVYIGATYVSSRSSTAGATAGIAIAGVVFYFIVIATGATLGVHHERVQTAGDAAAALVPIAGRFAGDLFAVGLLASALVAIPVLAATTASTAIDSFDRRPGADRSHRDPIFARVVLAALAIGCGVALAGVPPVRLLFVSGVVAGIVTPLTLALLMLVARNANVMASQTISLRAAVGGWLVTAIVGTTVVAYLVVTAFGRP